MQGRSLRKRLISIFVITALAVTAFGFFDSASKVGLAIVASFIAAIITFGYYAIVALVRWIYGRYGESGAEKLKYVLTGALLMNFMPILGVMELWFLLALYSWPAQLFANFTNIQPPLLCVTIPFWSIVGGLSGYLCFIRKQSVSE